MGTRLRLGAGRLEGSCSLGCLLMKDMNVKDEDIVLVEGGRI